MNRTWKRLTAILAAAMLTASALSGCGKKPSYDVNEFVRLDSYKGIAVEEYTYEISKEMIEQQVMLARSNYAEYSEKKTAAALTDQVNIDYTGYMDGKTFEGGSAADFDLTLGSGMFIDGFEDGLVGAKPGETVTLELHFPDPYPNNPDYSGKHVQFVVKVNHIYEQKLPAYTDAFVKEYYSYENIAAFEQAIRDALAEQAESSRNSYIINQAWSKVLDSAEILSYPTDDYNAMYADYIEYYTELAGEYDMGLNEYLSSNFGVSVEEFQSDIKAEIESYLKEQIVIDYIAQKENISVSDDEYKTGALNYARYYGMSSVEELETYYDKEDIRMNLLRDKVLEFVGDCAQIVGK